MRMHTVLGALIAIGLAACGGTAGDSTTSSSAETSTTGPTTTTTLPGFTVTSEDGAVTLEVPHEALAEDPGITITVLPPEEYPPELASAAQNPNTRIYRLLPDDVTFGAPARLTRTIDASNFGELAEYEVPIVVLLVRDSNGDYEPLGDIHVLRRRDHIEVSGDITHFSTMVTVSEQQSMTLVTDDTHQGFATETGVDLFVDALFDGLGGGRLDPPTELEGWARNRSGHMDFAMNGAPLGISCNEPRDEPVMARVGFRFDLGVGAGPTAVGLRNTPLLAPQIGTVPVLVKSSVEVMCLSPDTSLVAWGADIGLQVDHPGGMVYIPSGDFRGGYSGLKGSVRWIDDGPRPQVGWIGLICDVNGNGILDAGDAVYQPYMVEYPGGVATMGDFTLPLFGYADYFVYAVSGEAYDSVITNGPNGMPLLEALGDYAALFSGNGRFETSLGIFGTDGVPAVITVGPEEDAFEESWPLLMMWEPRF